MASIQPADSSDVDAQAADTQIWANEEGGCRGKMTRPRVVGIGLAVACAALGLGLYFGLAGSGGNSVDRIVGQSIDPNAIGCFRDIRRNRVAMDILVDQAMTPQICNDYCEGGGTRGAEYAYYTLQWGVECWCAEEDVDLDVNGAGNCDYPCPGDDSLICGGYLGFTAYDIGVEASSPAPAPTPGSSGGNIPTSCDRVAEVRVTSSTMYLEGGGCATLTTLYEGQGSNGELYILDEDGEITDGDPTGYWLLARDLRIVDGVTLYVHGAEADGDADILRLQSNGPDDFYEVRAHGGSLSFKNTKVTSWDTDSRKEQTTYEDGRSFINCVSEVKAGDDCDGAAKNDMGECRMDIIDSTMGNLGWFDAESYGLTWKVRGFCKDKSNPEVFDRTDVYGDIQGSDIYGMYYGMYSYGHQGGVWTNNKMHDNILYGFDPHDDSDDLTIADNEVYGNGNHGIIASKRCNNVKIYRNEVYDGGESAAGIFLHRSSDNAEVYDNYVHDMQDAGMALLESFDADIYDNLFENVKYGIRLSLGSARNHIHSNTFDDCSGVGFYTYEGSDEPDASDGRPSENIFEANIVSNTATGVKISQGDSNEFLDNTFTGTEELEFKESSNTRWIGNSLPSGACLEDSTDFTSDSDSISKCRR